MLEKTVECQGKLYNMLGKTVKYAGENCKMLEKTVKCQRKLRNAWGKLKNAWGKLKNAWEKLKNAWGKMLGETEKLTLARTSKSYFS